MPTMIYPAGKRFLIRKSSNAENCPPTSTAPFTKKTDALVTARQASRRRRARVVSGNVPFKVKKVLQNAQRRASKAQHAHKRVKLETPEPLHCVAPSEPLELVYETQETSAEAPTSTTQPQPLPDMWHFPRFLRRPPPEVWPVPVRRENVDACDPEVMGVPMDYIKDGLEVTGASMWHLVKTAHIDSSSMGHRAALPDEVNVVIADHAMLQSATALPSSYPTHVLAVWDLPISQPVYPGSGVNPETGRRKVSLIAAHNLVLATHCAKWFKLPFSPRVTERRVAVNEGGAPGTSLNLPVVPLAVPHPPSFMYLLQTMYTHKVSWLLDQLVPVQKPAVVFPTPQNPQPRNAHYIQETARRLAARFTPQAIVGMLGTVIGLWQNAIYLGVSDARLWVGIDWSWDMLLTGLAIAIGRPELVSRPQPRPQWPVQAVDVKV